MSYIYVLMIVKMTPGKTVGKKKKRVAGKAIREKNVVKFALKAGKLAVEAAIAEKVSVTFARKGRVYTLHPDGTEVIGEKLPEKVYLPVSKRRIILH